MNTQPTIFQVAKEMADSEDLPIRKRRKLRRTWFENVNKEELYPMPDFIRERMAKLLA